MQRLTEGRAFAAHDVVNAPAVALMDEIEAQGRVVLGQQQGLELLGVHALGHGLEGEDDRDRACSVARRLGRRRQDGEPARILAGAEGIGVQARSDFAARSRLGRPEISQRGAAEQSLGVVAKRIYPLKLTGRVDGGDEAVDGVLGVLCVDRRARSATGVDGGRARRVLRPEERGGDKGDGHCGSPFPAILQRQAGHCP